MFTGIIEETGIVSAVKKGSVSSRITFRAEKILNDIHEGDSIAVNGICLTAAGISKNTFTADVMAETMRRSTMGELCIGDKVNMERAMLCGGRFGGHIVSGHTDGTGMISDIKREENAVWVTVLAEKNIMKFIVEKGSVAIDGISLTVAAVGEMFFKVSVIPHTGQQTTLLTKKKGDKVNLECDIIGKYVQKLLNVTEQTENKSNITEELLSRHGFM